MKISELIALLEQRKEELGDTDVVTYNYGTDRVESVKGLMPLQCQYVSSTVVEIY